MEDGQILPHPVAKINHRNQRQRILDLLLAAHGGEVPSHELSRVSLQYSARVCELRRLGFHIENRVEHRDGQVHGFFRLVLGVGNTATTVLPADVHVPKQPQSAKLQGELFTNLPCHLDLG